MVQLSHPYMTTGKTIALTRKTTVSKVMCLLFNMMSSLIIDFLPRSNHLLISWLQSLSAVILEPKKIVCHVFHCVLIFWQEVMGLDAMILVFCFFFILVFSMLSFKPDYPLFSFTFKRLFSSSHFLA